MIFEPKGYSEKIFKLRYAFTEEETYQEACRRVADQIAKAEAPEKQQEHSDQFFDMLSQNLFMPGGRIWHGSGRAVPNLLNCFVKDVEDSRIGWGKILSDVIVISGSGGGVGIPFSKIRPNGSIIKGNGGTASGPVSLMRIINAAAEEIKGGGNRRSALMMALSYNHPDINEFLDAKLDLNQLNNANISVIIDDNFINAVKEDRDIELIFSGKVYGIYSANKLFDRLLENAIKNGEPGILNLGLANKMNNVYYSSEIVASNPCAEIVGEDKISCCLGSIVLPRFVNEKNEFDFGMLDEYLPTMIRFLDNVLEVNRYPLKEIEEQTKRYRKIGLGVLGIHDTLLKMGLKYTSKEGLAFIDKLMNFIKKKSYGASTYLAVEKGSFPEYKRDLFVKGNFIKTLPNGLKNKIKQYGIRNAALLTAAPTGTTGIICGFSGGIEPLFSYAYERRWNEDDTIKKEVVIHPLFEEFIREGKDVSHFEASHEISVENHIKIQHTIQKHVCSSISKTINLPKDFEDSDLKPMILKYIDGLKGITVYKDGSRGESPLTPLSIEEAKKHIEKEHVSAAAENKCAGGKCEL